VIHWNEAIARPRQTGGLRELLAVLRWFVRPSSMRFKRFVRQ